MAGDLRHLRSDSLTFYTSPTSGTGRRGNQSVVVPDRAKAKEFYDAVRRDDTALWRAVNANLVRRRAEIDAILARYGVPRVGRR